MCKAFSEEKIVKGSRRKCKQTVNSPILTVVLGGQTVRSFIEGLFYGLLKPCKNVNVL